MKVGTFMKMSAIFSFLVAAALALILGAILIGKGCSYASSAINTVEREGSLGALLRKYEWFKDAHASLDKKRADIQLYEKRIADIERRYEGRDLPPQYNLWQTEMIGVKSSYNSLAAEYNAQMAKINWRFTNIGDLPAGATEPLPRQVAIYQER